MASPAVEGRIEPHKKAHFSLHLSDRIRNTDDAAAAEYSVKCEPSTPTRHMHGCPPC